MLPERETVLVDVNGVLHEVGKESGQAQRGHHARILDDKYAISDTYMALATGALSYMDIPGDEVEMLALGLVKTYFTPVCVGLEKRMTGPHPVGSGRVINEGEMGRSLEVRFDSPAAPRGNNQGAIEKPAQVPHAEDKGQELTMKGLGSLGGGFFAVSDSAVIWYKCFKTFKLFSCLHLKKIIFHKQD